MKKLFRLFLAAVVVAAIIYINRYSDEVQDILSNIKFSNVGELMNNNGSGDVMTGDMMSGDLMTGEQTMTGNDMNAPTTQDTWASDSTAIVDSAITVADDSATVVIGQENSTTDKR